MAYDTIESSVESGQPIELYEFRVGTERTRLTSSENDVVIPSSLETYVAETISRGEIVDEVVARSSNRLEVRLPAENEFVAQFRSLAPGEFATLTLFRVHRGDLGGSDDRVTVFKGTVRNVSYVDNGRVAVVQVLAITSALSRPVPRRTYQGLCNHMLYDSRCTIDKDDPSFRLISTVTAVSGDVVTVSGANAFSGSFADFFVAGYVEFDNDFRTVVGQSGDDLTLILPFKESPLNQTVIARAGCKHRIVEDCTDKFVNVENFGGFPYVPKKNPFVTGIDNP